MDVAVIALAALVASALTLFSGFGLGTLLMPVVALFLPLELAIAITAVVHLANNLFKLALLGRYADRGAVLRFGIPAMVFAFLGALVLGWLAPLPPLYRYVVLGREFAVLPVKLIVGVLIVGFVLLEMAPGFARMAINRKYLPLGGVISGFFGGLSGHQGAFRSMFLIKVGLTKEAFIATGVVLAVMVDLARMVVYGTELAAQRATIPWLLVAVACGAAFLGAYGGAALLKKLTIRTIQVLVSVLLILVALGLIAGAI